VEVAARAARLADLPALEALVAQGIEAVWGEKGAELWMLEDAPTRPYEAGLRRLMNDANGSAVAGCIDDVPVGVLLADRRTLADGRRVARIAFVFVQAEARGVGVGEALVDAAVAWARDGGCLGIDGLALPGDREIKNLYERSGLTARAIIVHRSLPDDARQ
jgi:GNAT superfamily N-acetyltransferase